MVGKITGAAASVDVLGRSGLQHLSGFVLCSHPLAGDMMFLSISLLLSVCSITSNSHSCLSVTFLLVTRSFYLSIYLSPSINTSRIKSLIKPIDLTP